jgi:hypothetical protein
MAIPPISSFTTKQKQEEQKMTTDDLHWPWDDDVPHDFFTSFTFHLPIRRFEEENLPPKFLDMMALQSAQNYREACYFAQYKKKLFFTDYSSQAMLLLTIFEREINQTIVQWQRKQLGIDVRKFFAAYENGKHANYHGEDLEVLIDFNKYCNDAERKNWQAPTLGQSCSCIRTYCQQHHIAPFPEANELFFYHWSQMVSRRNRIMHLQTTRTVTLSEFYELKMFFEQFMFSYLSALSKLRTELLGFPGDDDNPLPQNLPKTAD